MHSIIDCILCMEFLVAGSWQMPISSDIVIVDSDSSFTFTKFIHTDFLSGTVAISI